MTPTQRSKRLLADEGYLVAIVEHWNPHVRIRQDLFGFADLLAIKPDHPPLLVQTTTTGTADRVRKILDSDIAPVALQSGFEIVVHGWRKLKVKRGGKATRWSPRIIPITKDDFACHSKPCATPQNSVA